MWCAPSAAYPWEIGDFGELPDAVAARASGQHDLVIVLVDAEDRKRFFHLTDDLQEASLLLGLRFLPHTRHDLLISDLVHGSQRLL